MADLSYASYLLHFPLQLVVFGAVIELGLPFSAFYGRGAMLAFFAVLIPLSIATYRWFELPMQRHLRTRFLGSRKVTRQAATGAGGGDAAERSADIPSPIGSLGQ